MTYLCPSVLLGPLDPRNARNWLGIAVAAISFGLFVPASAADQVSPPEGVLSNAKLNVRQGGGADQEGLLSRIKGPAAMLDVEGGPLARSELIAGAMDGVGANQGYVAGTIRLPDFRGAKLNFNWAGDEHGGQAVESRLSKAFDAIRLTWSSTLNRGFESAWTGSGASVASHINEGWLHWSPSATTYGVGLRETAHGDGSRNADLRTLQMTSLGSGTLLNSTATRLDDNGAHHTSDSLMYYGPLSAFQVTGEIDSADLRPTKASFGLERSIDQSWSLYLFAAQSLDAKQGSINIGAAREVGGFVASFYGGATESRSAYVGLRFVVALWPGARQSRWVGLH